MNNPQAIRIQQLAYLAGCIDCDGTIGIHIGDQYGNYKPVIKIFNTSKKMIDYLAKICKACYLPHYIYVSNPGRSKNRRYKKLFALVVQGYKRIKVWLPIITPFLYAKKKQAELLRAITELRLATPMTRQNWGRSYTSGQMEIIKKIQNLNYQNGKGRSRKSSTTMSKII